MVFTDLDNDINNILKYCQLFSLLLLYLNFYLLLSISKYTVTWIFLVFFQIISSDFSQNKQNSLKNEYSLQSTLDCSRSF